jgi:hypothetical protein
VSEHYRSLDDLREIGREELLKEQKATTKVRLNGPDVACTDTPVVPDLVVQKANRPASVRALLRVLVEDGNLFDRGGGLVKLGCVVN